MTEGKDNSSLKNITPSFIHDKITKNLSQWDETYTQWENLVQLHRDEASHLEEILSRTLKLGESNSALLIAPRGAGKTLLINGILLQLEERGCLKCGLVVHLCGLLQTSDVLALQQITRQLSLQKETANKTFGSFAENLAFLLQSLKEGSKEFSKPVIFILDEFDLFCQHKNQTLLYNLFDVAQSAQAPICVVGLTCRLDVIELLEKRVKSRFSHRQIYLLQNHTISNYFDIAKELLKLDNVERKAEIVRWNSHVDDVMSKSRIKEFLKRIFLLCKDIRVLKSYLTFVVCQMSTDEPLLQMKYFETAFSLYSVDAQKEILEGLSVLQLSLVIAMMHICLIYDGEPFNFEMVFHEYNKFCQRYSSIYTFDRRVVFKAYDELHRLEVILPVEQVRSSQQKEYLLMQLQIPINKIISTVPCLPNVPTYLSQWCSSNI